MSATIIMFPASASVVAQGTCMDIHTRGLSQISAGSRMDIHTTESAPALATKFTDHFLPICQASIDLLEADGRDFEDRCRRMLDCAGTAMIDELCAELQIVGEQMQVLVDGLELTRARLRTAVARLATDCGECRPESVS